LGDLATQAMALFSNLNYPSLRTEIQDLSERFKHVSKLWRKLDAPTKLIYVNKSRQNRYKKKSDDKAKPGGLKRAKSPSNSDRQSDAEFSRSATPSTNMDAEGSFQNGDSDKLRQLIGVASASPQIIALNNPNGGQFISQVNLNKAPVATSCNTEKIVLNMSQVSQPPKIIQLTNNQSNIINTSSNNSDKNKILMYQTQQNQVQPVAESNSINNNMSSPAVQSVTHFKVLESYMPQGLSCIQEFYLRNFFF